MRPGSRAHQRSRWLAAMIIMLAFVQASAAPQETQAPSLFVLEAAADSIAVKIGLQVADHLVSYDGKPMLSVAVLRAVEENTFNKSEVVLRVRRGEEMLTLTAPLGALGIQVRPAFAPPALDLYEEGRAAQKAQKPDDVITKWSAAAKVLQQAGDSSAAGWLYDRVGVTFEGQRKWKEAGEAFATAWELLKQSSDAAFQSRVLMALGRCSQNLNDFPAAQQRYEQAAQVDAAAGYELWEASDLGFLGIVVYNRGDLVGSQDHFSRGLSIHERRKPGSLFVANGLNSMAIVALARGDLEASREYHNRALTIRERLSPNSLDVANSLSNLGMLASRRGDLPAALEYHGRALSIRERLSPDSLDVGVSLNNLGADTYSRGDMTGARDFYNRSLAIHERLAPNSLGVAAILSNLGNVVRDYGDGIAAEDYYRRAFAIRERQAPDSLVMASSLANLGSISRDRGDLAASHEYHSRALTIRERLAPNSLVMALSLSSLGDVAMSRDDHALAQDYYSRVLAIREREAPDSLSVADTLNSVGIIASDRGDLAAARDHFSRALSIRERLAPNSLRMSYGLNALGVLALKERRFPDATVFFTRSIAIVEDQRWQIRSAETRALLLAQNTEPYMGLLRAQLALGDLPAAFATAERARARSLLEILTEARAEIREGIERSLLERERVLQQQLNDKAARQTQVLGGKHTDEEAAAVKRELDGLLTQYQELQAEIRIKSPGYAALTQPQPLGLPEIQQQLLTEGALLLEYVLGADSSHLFAVTTDSIKSFALPKRAEIEQAARRVTELMMARQPLRGETLRQRQARIEKADAEYPAAAAALSRIILGPLGRELAGQRLLIVADGALQYVPIGALPAPNGDGVTPLIVSHEVVNLPSASVVALMRRQWQGRAPADKLVAVLADPVFDPDDPRLKRSPRQTQPSQPVAATIPARLSETIRNAGLFNDRGSISRLPFTREEADAIMAAAPAGQSTKAIDFKASRATAMSAELGQYRIVHLATHGLLDTEHPELSGIVLSLVDEQGKSQDGFLRLHEVYNLKWSAELVVLSACQTALGKEIRGEGLVGLTRGFMYAGSKRVLASLWNVNDSVTAHLMKQFYQGMLVKGLQPAAALRAAQLDMWKRKASRAPYYWAAFVLQGEFK